MVIDKLLDEEKRQHEHVRVTMARLKSEKDGWFPSSQYSHYIFVNCKLQCLRMGTSWMFLGNLIQRRDQNLSLWLNDKYKTEASNNE